MPAPLDPTYGYDLPALLRVSAPDAPPGFAEFWRQTYAQTLTQPPAIARREIDCRDSSKRLFEIEFNGWRGFRVGGWLLVPREANWTRGLVMGHGYGGRGEASLEVPGPPCAAIFPCARGFNRSARASIPGTSKAHVLHGIEAKETYVHRGCIADLWAAASVLLQLFPQIEGRLDYSGGSFGGGLGAVALAFDRRFARAHLGVPSFGNYPLRVQLPCKGSGEAVSQYWGSRPEVLEPLAFYDAASAARFITAPTLVAPALSDGAVPPPGQFAVYNALEADKELWVRASGHPSLPDEDRALAARLSQWFER